MLLVKEEESTTFYLCEHFTSARIFSHHEKISVFFWTDEKEEFFFSLTPPEAKPKSIGRSLQLNGTVVTRVQ